MGRTKADADRPLTSLGERIMLAAEAAGFTQTSLERAARFSGGYLTKLLYRPQDRIDVTKLETLVDLLDVRMHWLATGREPMREGGVRADVEEAIIVARGLGVTEDVFWFVRARDRGETNTAADWTNAFLAEHKRRVNDAAYAKAAKRVAMSEEKRAKKPTRTPAAPPRRAPKVA